MEFYVYFVIVVVILISLATSLIISKLPRGKTFDEVLSEKKKLAEKLYGTSGKKSQKSKKQPPNAGKKSKDKVKVKEAEPPSSEDTMDAPDEKPPSPKGHVEFSEAEIITDSDSPRIKKQLSVTSGGKKSGGKKNGGKASGTGILINKSETSAVKAAAAPAEPMNHFEQIHPKDDAEILRAAAHRDELAESRNQPGGKSDRNAAANRDSKKGKNPKVHADKEEKVAAAPVVVEEKAVVAKKVPDSGGAGSTKSTKKSIGRKQESTGLAVQKIIAETDEIGVNFLIPLLAKAELSRSEIQIIIEYLLNKQSDTITVNHSEWTEGKSDVVQKLKKQIELKEKALQDEQEASAGMQARLRELRAEINLEKSQYNANLKQYIEEIAQKTKDLQNMTTDYQQLNEKYVNEKQQMTVQMQQLQSKLLQEKKANSQEHLQQIQQLTEANNVLNSEIIAKTKLINDVNEQFQKFASEKHQLIETVKKEYEAKMAEYEMIMRKKEEQQLYLEQDLQKIRQMADHDAEALRRLKENFDVKRYEVEQYKTQLAEMTKNNHNIEDMGKVEIRNLQNALDSCKTDLTRSRSEANEFRNKSEDLDAQVVELKRQISLWSGKIHEQTVQMTEMDANLTGYKTDLEDKSAKLAEAENKIRCFGEEKERLEKQIEDLKGKNNDTTEIQRAAAQDVENRTRSKIIKIFPNIPTGPTQYDQWIEHVGEYLRECCTSTSSIQHSATIINTSASNSCKNNSNSESSDVGADGKNVTTNNHSVESEDGADGSSDDRLETLLLQNAQLQRTVDEYKIIVADTEGLLKNLELKVKEQDAYWRKVVETKDEELQGLKISSCPPINND
ncbi:ribosome-binding protein 1 isoform X2 [Lutzomyia longipalpis]|uniref:Putative ribosome binding protein 1 log a dog n=1 Tax=Lutzomyia longipalpis TaxID=7200 RepID=A0A7G3AY97_LUTLO|nr:ribosome-binding protein 1 isoform X2 [Lutzomyia longipalpis]XP_055676458.1 ribosome-binding protein 1 isoform X2 [Lutzomyia longipalpis]